MTEHNIFKVEYYWYEGEHEECLLIKAVEIEEFENKDLQYYYAIGSDVRFFVEGEAHVGKVKSFDLEVHVLQVSEDGAEDVWEFDESDYQTIIRIL